MKLLKHLLTTSLITTSLFAFNENNETTITPDELEKINAKEIPIIDTISGKVGYSYGVTNRTDDNGGVPDVPDPSSEDVSIAFRAVFSNGYIPYFKPYIDFSTLINEDKNIYIPSVGLRHDFRMKKSWIEPYVGIGIGYAFLDRTKQPVVGAEAYSENGQSSNLTLEGGVDFYFSDHFAFDLSARYDAYDITTTIGGNYTLTTLHDKASLSLMLGLVYRFGKNISTADDDMDGVLNRKDYCPNTPINAKVDEFGCALDEDKDSVINLYDECPNTILGAPVDEKGCALDSDADGVIDLNDRCPLTIPNLPVTECGCPPYKFDFVLGYKFNTFEVKDLIENPRFPIVQFLQKHENYHVKIVGYADNIGKKEYNKYLSLKRAGEARRFLLDRGIDESRIQILGRGDAEELYMNDSEENRNKNRRIQVQLFRVDKSLVK